ncbi:hypothetical protein [Ferrovibrio terrae]|uniref:hypothetical protein n=1 Tax=Ferrovibrio terrae TaxID=2594003 RepID=UPI0031383A5E
MATFLEYRAQDWDNRRLWLGVAMSLLLHGLIVLLLLVEPWTWRIQPEPPPILAEFVMPEPPKPTPTPAPPPAPQPAPTQAQAPPAQQQTMTPEPSRPVPPPSIPQLQRAPVTEAPSKAPPSAGERARPQAAEKPQPAPVPDRAGPSTVTAPPAQRQQQSPPRPTGNRDAGAPGAAGATGETMTQSESDYFLSQVVSAWVIDFDAPQFADIRIFGRYRVLPNGMLAPPFGKNDPWDMRAMVENWDQIAVDRRPQAAAFRTAIETFLRAMRLAQPMRMPPNPEGYPKVLELNFRIGDL